MPSAFAGKVYAKLQEVPAGRVTTYRELSKAVGNSSSQAVGQVLRRNPYAPEVPCHRVVKSDGSIGGFQGCVEGDPVDEKIRLLQEEGVEIEDGKVKEFEKRKHSF